jgi:diguanylate cyclase (GGDEF)-like protein
MSRSVAALGLLLAVGMAMAASPVVQLADDLDRVEVWPSVRVLADPGKTWGIQDVLAKREAFTAPATAYGTLGMRTEAMWLHIPVAVDAKSNGLWVLDIDYAVLNSVDIYAVVNQQVVKQAKVGNMVRRADKPIDGRANSAGFSLAPGTAYDVYLRIENNGTMILPITFVKPAAFHADSLREQMLQGLLTGLAFCLLLYSLAQWISLGEHLFVKYAILISGSLLFSLLHFGVGGQFFWPDNHWVELHIGGLSALLASAGSFLFIEQALQGADMKPWMSRLMRAGACLMVFFGFCYAMNWLDIKQVTTIVSTLGLAPSLLGLPGAVHRARRGDSVGWYFLAAWFIYFVTTYVLIEVIKGTLPANFWTMHSFQFGATVDMLLFMRVLGLQTKQLKLAVSQAKLERDTLHSLAHTDPLTGLPNRRIINSAISTAIASGRKDEMLAVYMLDLDGFKQVNDQYGHDVGDELLIAVANRLKANLRSADIISRLGGDEFLVMSTGIKNPGQAQELGEKLVKAIGEPFVVGAHNCQVGLTVGYAIAPLDANDTRTVLKCADAAMYAGKQAGKHRVCRASTSDRAG